MTPPEECGRRAVIDIGTNSVKLLVADVSGDRIAPVWERGRQTRLGEGFYDTHTLQPAAIARTVEAVDAFRLRAGELGAQNLRVVATSATRDASNAAELIDAIRERSRIVVETLSGRTEAEWSFRGSMTACGPDAQTALVIDVGGGSTEFIVGDAGRLAWSESFELGTVRWLERSHPGNPPAPGELQACRDSIDVFLRQRVAPGLLPALESVRDDAPFLVGVGGTFGILARMELAAEEFDRERIEALRLDAATVTDWVERLWRLTFEERGALPGLPSERADVMLMGAAIIERIMAAFGFGTLRPSLRGLRFAALMD